MDDSLKILEGRLAPKIYEILSSEGITNLRPAQLKAINAGLLEGTNLLICTPTASGKTLIAELAMIEKILRSNLKAVYVLPLKALANEKFKDFKRKYGEIIKVVQSTGDFDSNDSILATYDLILLTPEKLDSILRHKTPWITDVGVFVIDEIHLLNDVSRGPTTEVVITLLKDICPTAQFISLSATIGNPEELSAWLNATLIIDEFRPVQLRQGILYQNNLEFFE